MGKLFGTDGVRGIANKELTADLAYKLGKAGAYVLTGETKHIPKILVGTDTRISGDMLESALSAGICSVGAEVVVLGVLPTPAISYLTRLYKADAGIVISASHNPFEFNGIKFFNSNGYKLSDELEEKIENIVLNDIDNLPIPIGENIGRRLYMTDGVRDYTNFIVDISDNDFKEIKVVLDCANGAAYRTSPIVFEKLNAEIVTINNNPDGSNINKKCGSTDLLDLINTVVNEKADIGLAFDGDADRVLAVDEKGNVVDGDQIMAIIGMDLKERNMLTDNTIVATVMSNLGFDIMAKENGIIVKKTKVGDRYVLQEMLENDFILGGEQSGHIIFLKHNTTGDGLLTAVQLVNVMKKTGRKLSELSSIMNILPQILVNARVKNENKNKYLSDDLVAKYCKELETEFNGKGRVLIRASGTEPLVRVMIEGMNKDYIKKRAEELSKIIEERLG
ncbi:MAG: phosphoglucosamine mutase [Clostridiales bacterium]